MAKYVYYCNECRTTFEVEVDAAQGVPRTSECPNCGSPNAMKAFSVEDLNPGGGSCAPGSSC